MPVVYLAGGPGGNSYEFAELAGNALERRRRMVYFDQRGTGRSERPPGGDYALATLVDDIEALRVHLGVARIAIVAHPFGGILALEYAAKYPRRVSAMVLAGPAWNTPLSCRERVGHLKTAAPAAYGQLTAMAPGDGEVCAAISRSVGGADWERYNDASMFPLPDTRRRQKAAELESGLKNTRELPNAIFKEGSLSYRFARAARVRAPALIVAGAKDYAAGLGSQRALAKALPRARLLVYPDYGHWMFIYDPERFARDAGTFLAAHR